jgi:predicted membrane-bound dolichyl-phosphate-mannose-protein mannosyltransferase
VGLCLVFATELALSTRQLSETFDEPCHVYAGYRYLTAGDFGVNPEHPPLLKLIAALPVLSLHPKMPQEDQVRFRGACGGVGVLLFRLNDVRPILLRARYAAGLFSMLLVVLLFLAVREMFGAGAALFALGLAIFEPNLLANGALVTTDMAATSMLFGTVYAFWRYTERPTVARMLVCGAAAGLTLASKHSGVLVLPILFALGAVDWLKPKPAGSLAEHGLRRRAGVLLAALFVITVVALVVLWAFYEFRYQARPAPLAISPPLPVYLNQLSPRFVTKMLLGVTNVHLLPEE